MIMIMSCHPHILSLKKNPSFFFLSLFFFPYSCRVSLPFVCVCVFSNTPFWLTAAHMVPFKCIFFLLFSVWPFLDSIEHPPPTVLIPTSLLVFPSFFVYAKRKCFHFYEIKKRRKIQNGAFIQSDDSSLFLLADISTVNITDESNSITTAPECLCAIMSGDQSNKCQGRSFL